MKINNTYFMTAGLVLLAVLSKGVFAAQALGLGQVANNLMDPVGVMVGFVHTACGLIGGSFIFASIVKYFEHRRSPTRVPMSTVVFLMIAGVVLVALPIVSYVSTYGFPYSLIQLK